MLTNKTNNVSLMNAINSQCLLLMALADSASHIQDQINNRDSACLTIVATHRLLLKTELASSVKSFLIQAKTENNV